jgi:hypothetical protein
MIARARKALGARSVPAKVIEVEDHSLAVGGVAYSAQKLKRNVVTTKPVTRPS